MHGEYLRTFAQRISSFAAAARCFPKAHLRADREDLISCRARKVTYDTISILNKAIMEIVLLIISILLSLASFAGVVMGIVAIHKTTSRKDFTFRPVVHIVCAILVAPIELILGTIELYKLPNIKT